MLPGANPKDKDANVRAWAADHGSLARSAIDTGVQRCQALLTRSLTQSAADAESVWAELEPVAHQVGLHFQAFQLATTRVCERLNLPQGEG